MSRDIHGVAVDAGSGLEATIRDLKGADARPDDLLVFKRNVLRELGGSASTILVDANCGPDLLADYPAQCAPMVAFEADVYHISDDDRMTVVPEHITVADYPKMGVKQLKFFMYYAPDDLPNINQKKLDLIEKIGAQCAEHGLTYLLEPLVYHPSLKPGTLEYARAKPDLVRRATEAFADRRLGADILKVEFPFDLAFVEGFGQADMSRADAIKALLDAAAPAQGRGLVYLSAGVTFDWFLAPLKLAVEAGVDFSGFMCGRAIWSDAVEIFGLQGEEPLRAWLRDTGRKRLDLLIEAVS